MKLSRPSRIVAALIALLSILFMQLAVAAYACPTPVVADIAIQAVVDCADMDMEQPALCEAHAQPGHQSLDKPGAPQVQPFIAASLLVTLPPVIVGTAPTEDLHADVLLARVTAPPLAIRNCCFRI